MPIDTYTLLKLMHFLGIALGAGGAYMSDLMFFTTIRDHIISKTELLFLKLGSIMVWTGLGILYLSGISLFLLNPEFYAASSKFQVKITVVLILTLNGIFFHLSHLPRMTRHTDTHLPSSDEFSRKKRLLFFSGVISVTSWTSALILGALRSIPLTYLQGLAIYGAVILCGFIAAELIKHRLLPHHKHRKP